MTTVETAWISAGGGVSPSASPIEIANLVVGIVGALGTIIALVVAIVLGLHEAHRFREEAVDRDTERRSEAEAQERAQAERISAVAHVNRTPEIIRVIGGEDERVHRASVTVHNASALPIFDATVIFPKEDGFEVAPVGFIPGGEKIDARLPRLPSADLDGQPLEVVFRDAGERWWSRDAEGRLHRHEADPTPRPSTEEGVD